MAVYLYIRQHLVHTANSVPCTPKKEPLVDFLQSFIRNFRLSGASRNDLPQDFHPATTEAL